MSTATIMRRISSAVTRGVVSLVEAATRMQVLQVTTRGALAPSGDAAVTVGDPQVRDGVEYWEPYGFTSRPYAGAEALLLNVGAAADHPVAVCVSDRRYRPLTLIEGEVGCYHSGGHGLLLTSTGVFLGASGPGVPVEIGGNTSVAGTFQATVSVAAPVATFATSLSTGTLAFTSLSGGGGISGGGGTLAAPTINATTNFQANGVPGVTVVAGPGSTLTINKGIITGVA